MGIARSAAAVVVVVTLAGCAAGPPAVIYKTQEVKVPVPVAYPRITMPPKPTLPLASLSSNAAIGDVLHAYAESLQVCIDYAHRQGAVIEAIDAGAAPVQSSHQ